MIITYNTLIDKRIKRLEGDIECLNKVCKSLIWQDVDIEIELIRNVQSDLMFIIDNLKLEKQLKAKNKLIISSNPKNSMGSWYKLFNDWMAKKAKT